MDKINIYSTDKNGYERLSNILNGTVKEEIVGRKGKVLIEFKTVEHAYQCKKALFYKQYDLAISIANSSNGWQAQKLSKQIKVDDNWDKISEDELYKSMKLCFEQNPKSLELLLSTKDAELVHKHPYIKLGKWSEVFPKLLMKIRQDYVCSKT